MLIDRTMPLGTMPLGTMPLGTALTVTHATDRGPRTHNADAFAVGRRTFVVADGVGDSTAAAEAAWAAARAAALPTDPVAAVLAARDALQVHTGDAVVVVATARPGGGFDVAWAGDARAYASDGEDLVQLTTDHTVAEYFRERGIKAERRMEHVVTNTVRHATPENIGRAFTRAPRLVLVSDGVYGPLGHNGIEAIMSGNASAERLVRAALYARGTDNATALVVS
ncbi:serine/threonine protein phosphatase [Lentzea sp. DG1S-22]|uniref:PP2C family protein-serine/threonine phosphatase n=1 Tax=Lentzea sp. DG1S-22 TaxID=3108822 RepID=UPI002E7608CC|nr:serine/threonine protein phosphatase [Lentzea sp. DG1S-22]WVH83787.1 serine/threonine protein phosphatase [Lentzea sp. DG1S-22]